MAKKKTVREKAVEKAYSQDSVTLEKCGKVVKLREISFGDFASMSRFFGGFMAQFVAVAIDKDGNQIPPEKMNRAAVIDAVIQGLSNDDAAAFKLMASSCDLSEDKIKTLSVGDGGQLLSACVRNVDSAEVSRFFQHAIEMTTAIQASG